MSDDFPMRLPAVLRATGLSKSTLYRRIRAGQFPRPIKFANLVGGFWSSLVVAAFVERRRTRIAKQRAVVTAALIAFG